MRKELTEARKALAKGRSDESLVHLWNVLEPARLEGDRGTLRAVAQLATAIQAQGGPDQREAERLLEAVQEAAVEEGTPDVVVRLPGGGEAVNGGGFMTEGEAAGEIEEEEQATGGLARWIFPLIFLIVVIANVINGLLGD